MSNDLISRSALKKAITEKLGIYLDGTLNNRLLFGIIDNAPTVFDDKAYSDGYTQGTCDCEHAHERPQGEWIIHNSFDGWVECPFCHVGRTVFEKLPKFCENCGADMRGGAE